VQYQYQLSAAQTKKFTTQNETKNKKSRVAHPAHKF